MKKLKVWKTITIGTHKSIQELAKEVEKKHKISGWAKELLPNLEVSKTEETIELYQTTVKEITGKKIATTTEIYKAIENNGYDICPDETALQLRLVYDDQPMGWEAVLSEPKTDAGGGLDVFDVGRRSGGSWVSGRCARPDDHWDADDRLVFCRKPLEDRNLASLGSLPLRDKNGKFTSKPEVEVIESIPTKICWGGRTWVEEK